MIKIGIIGYGYWGPNLLRNFFSVNGCSVIKVCDLRKKRLELAKKQFPSVGITLQAGEIINNDEIEAVVIATPVSSHYSLARRCLLADKHVLVEKPMAKSSREASALISLARKKEKILMVDYTFLYSLAVRKIKKLIDRNELGKIQYFDSTRINLGLFQSDINVLWDLAPHDISMLCHLIHENPRSIQATGISHTVNKLENIAYLTLKYKSGIIAHISCSWSSPVKIRMTLIGGDKKIIRYDDLEPTEKIKIYDTGYNIRSEEKKRKLLVSYRVGDIYIPKIDNQEPLKEMAEDFIKSIKSHNEPIANCKIGLKVVKILEIAQRSLKSKSKEIPYQ